MPLGYPLLVRLGGCCLRRLPDCRTAGVRSARLSIAGLGQRLHNHRQHIRRARCSAAARDRFGKIDIGVEFGDQLA